MEVAAIIGTDDGKKRPVPRYGLRTGLIPIRQLPNHNVHVAEAAAARSQPLPQVVQNTVEVDVVAGCLL